jgi:hypothetical protein
MPAPAIGLRLGVALAPDADATELEHATSQLREELLELDLERVDRPTEPAPPGSRGRDVAALGTLIVGACRGAFGAVLTAVQSWVARLSSRSATIASDGDSLEPTNASHEDQRRLVESFLARRPP